MLKAGEENSLISTMLESTNHSSSFGFEYSNSQVLPHVQAAASAQLEEMIYRKNGTF